MIKVERMKDSRPASLDKTYGSSVKPPKVEGKTELEAVLLGIAAHRAEVAAGKKKLVDFSFPYERYSDREVVETLRKMFHGKCAYCESRYASTQPMDVEHWRPKGKVKENKRGSAEELGYYWLASEWTNLLPSCIDCNRARTQFDTLNQKAVLLGKKNQFPVDGQRTAEHEKDKNRDGGGEKALLVNPCLEDPEKLFRYDDQGLILPESQDRNSLDHQRAMESIRVYALNRSELVTERLALIQMVDRRLRLIDKLADIRTSLRDKGMSMEADGISDVISAELDLLLEMRKADQPFAGLMRQLMRDVRPSP